ncbi:transcriptional regulator [Streptomyces sp. SID8366]|uniref:Rrf2 family transcriptional regulator n=1 Tax=unclassified Streptomyces TaxID=2593676 RepID=UPI000DB978EF|nr:Rrf2 family transcriptional regulator [Streptomyces sp. PsTaAH-130]MYU04208.1 transcriptional regulator [Streptomyces sp. SID8366]MYU61546.1 transcriptional regulator [Streptomyces sp. SID69]RAJ48544.1 Rrf2 family protein [Streptomyces sp. PsTaAH-130]
MSANSRLTVATHVLVWMELYRRQGGTVATSEQIAESVNTNPVVIRRLLGDLRKAGLVSSRRGAGAGWVLARDPAQISLLEVYDAVEPGALFALHRALPNQECPVGRGIQPVMQEVYDQAEAAVRRELGKSTLADVLRGVLAAH